MRQRVIKEEVDKILQEYGINGHHEVIGAAISDNQFEGRMLEFVRMHEESHKALALRLDNHAARINSNEKAIWGGGGMLTALTVLVLTKQIGLW